MPRGRQDRLNATCREDSRKLRAHAGQSGIGAFSSRLTCSASPGPRSCSRALRAEEARRFRDLPRIGLLPVLGTDDNPGAVYADGLLDQAAVKAELAEKEWVIAEGLRKLTALRASRDEVRPDAGALRPTVSGA